MKVKPMVSQLHALKFFVECECAFPDIPKSKHFKCAQIESLFLVRALET